MKKQKPKQVESAIQIALVLWCRTRPLFKGVFSIPNGGSRNKLEAYRLKREGVRAGIPDLLFPLPQGRTLWLELKTKKGRLSPVQKDVMAELEKDGHAVLVGYGYDDAIGKLTTFEREWNAK